MVETVSPNKNFNMPVDDIINQALDAIGGEHINNQEMKRARTALNLLFIDMQTNGAAPLSSIETVSVAFTSGSADGYSLGSDVFSVLNAVVKVSAASGETTDLILTKISQAEFLEIPTKHTLGRPTKFMVSQGVSDTTISVWPTPDADSKYTFSAWALKKTADVDRSYQLVDFPTKYLPTIVKGLRYYMAELRTGVSLQDKQWLKNEYQESLMKVLDDDRERVDLNLYPASRPQLGTT